MICDVKKLKEYFDKRFNELKNSLDVNNITLANFKSEIKQTCKNQKIKQIIKSKYWSRQETPSAANNSTGTTNWARRKLCFRIDSFPKQNSEKYLKTSSNL